MQPGLWQQPVWREPLLQGELPCCLAAAQIRDMETEAMQPLLIAGTAFLLGEDCPCTGRVVLFQLTRANSRWQGEVASSRCGHDSTWISMPTFRMLGLQEWSSYCHLALHPAHA